MSAGFQLDWHRGEAGCEIVAHKGGALWYEKLSDIFFFRNTEGFCECATRANSGATSSSSESTGTHSELLKKELAYPIDAFRLERLAKQLRECDEE